ncbi:glycoside hydrolase family 43 protein [Pelagicoccus sp. SDUM812003]|uniref:glycoside hydrolase family 43 protein n=1 Tax=Pelagicoccus sp. SDUM812003 TaxID=3041267 RepID=UPI0028106ABB|nr:glycoside hydrolase family 43 protein [Pelagicoccus sp. SDUM812003]MDQ8203960.1 glycoside hydrolase family 43 protein [Pelagicoccus sp. SDUM812003]
MNLVPLFCATALSLSVSADAGNPIITDVFTADPAALVHDGRVYLYTGHDEAEVDKPGYVMNEWLVFSSDDMVDWKAEGSPLSLDDFEWANVHAWAGHAIERDGKFYWYITAWEEARGEFGIGVAVSDSPTGPFKDALGKPLVTSDLTENPMNYEDRRILWDDIDPAAYIDEDGQAYLFWGNTNCYWAKLKDSMVELDGEIHQIELPDFVEAPYIHRKGGLYYLTYSKGFPERTAYATSESLEGPWEYRGVIKQLAGNCNTNHQAVVEFKGRDYFIYHNGGLRTGGSFRRSVCVDYLRYGEDGSILPILPTEEGVVSADEPLER